MAFSRELDHESPRQHSRNANGVESLTNHVQRLLLKENSKRARKGIDQWTVKGGGSLGRARRIMILDQTTEAKKDPGRG
jgi:hypothetical protein